MIRLNHNCPLCKKEMLLTQDKVIKDDLMIHLTCYEKLLLDKFLNKRGRRYEVQ